MSNKTISKDKCSKGPAVYFMRCVKNGRHYIGATMNGADWRIRNHLSLLRSGKHKNKRLQEDFVKFGETSFEFGTYCECSLDELLALETEAYTKLRALFPDGYNIAMPPKTWGMDTSGRFSGRKKLGNVLFAKRVSPEMAARLAEVAGGPIPLDLKPSDEQLDQMDRLMHGDPYKEKLGIPGVKPLRVGLDKVVLEQAETIERLEEIIEEAKAKALEPQTEDGLYWKEKYLEVKKRVEALEKMGYG